MSESERDPRELELAFMMGHTQLSQGFGNLFQVASAIKALTDLLLAKGVVAGEELGREVERARGELAASEFGRGLQVIMQPDARDKRTAPTHTLDCAARLQHCRSACCALDVALSAQDLEEGGLRWNLARPYLMRRGRDGYCCHRDGTSGGCAVYADRPLVCRGYSCARDQRIWLDFDAMVPNTASIDALLARSDRPRLEGRDAWEAPPDATATLSARMEPAPVGEDSRDPAAAAAPPPVKADAPGR